MDVKANPCLHTGVKTIVVLEAFDMHEITGVKCQDCGKIIKQQQK